MRMEQRAGYRAPEGTPAVAAAITRASAAAWATGAWAAAALTLFAGLGGLVTAAAPVWAAATGPVTAGSGAAAPVTAKAAAQDAVTADDVSARGPKDAGSRGEDRGWPVDGERGALRPVVVRGWDPPATPWAAGHRGVDLATRAGSRVRAAAHGRVSFAGPVGGRGVLVVELARSGDPPLRLTYEPVLASVTTGERVHTGEPVGTVQDGPFHCERACLHWGLLRGGSYLDPLSLLPPEMLRAGPARLLPVFGVPVPGETGDAVRLVVAGTRSSSVGGLATALALAGAAAWAGRRLRRPAGARPRGFRRVSRERRAAPSPRPPP